MSSGPPIKRLKQPCLKFTTLTSPSVPVGSISGNGTVVVNAEIKNDHQLKFMNHDEVREMYIRLEEVALINHFQIKDVPKDGNCALHAVIDQLQAQGEDASHSVSAEDASKYSVSSLRRDAVTHIRAKEVDKGFLVHQEYPNLQTYFDKQAVSGTWCDELMIRSVSDVLQRQIIIFNETGNRTVIDPEVLHGTVDQDTGILSMKEPLVIGLMTDYHYVSFISCRKDVGNLKDNMNSQCTEIIEPNSTQVEKVTKCNCNTNCDSSKTRSSDICIGCIHDIHKGGRHYVSCSTCTKHNDVVRKHSHKGRIPAIATKLGTIFRKEIVKEHIASLAHTEAVKCERLSKLNKVEVAQTAPMDRLISKGNEHIANKMGGMMVTVYNDAKHLTLSANSWPSRVVANQKAMQFKFNDRDLRDVSRKSDSQDQYDMQYLTPKNHRILLKCIANSHRSEVFNKLLNARAASIRLDGSVDRSQIDKIYLLCKVVAQDGDTQEFFLGIAEPSKRGAAGIFEALQAALTATFGEQGRHLLNLMSSVVTDGASVNIGEKNGLWSLLQDHIRASGCVRPLLKVWCAVHRSQLAWESVTNTVAEVGHLFQSLVSLVSYFHTSGVRTRELKNLAKRENLVLRHLPRLFEVRWTEFSYELLNTVMESWVALVLYLRQSTDQAALGHHAFLTSVATIGLVSFLADVLAVFSRFQKKLQRDSTTLLDMHKEVTTVKSSITALKVKPLIGGWQDKFQQASSTNEDGEVMWQRVTLKKPAMSRRKEHHLYVTDRRDCSAICNEVADGLVEFLTQRFAIDNIQIEKLSAFVRFDADKVDMVAVHQAIAPDLDITELSMEFSEQATDKDFTTLNLPEMVKRLSTKASDCYTNTLKALARLLAAKPHSADVERCISANNLLKTSLRNRLNIDTENLYLFIHHNLPVVTEWDPRQAVLEWLKQKDRRTRIPQKSREQNYFKHVFREAAEKKTYFSDTDTCSSSEAEDE